MLAVRSSPHLLAPCLETANLLIGRLYPAGLNSFFGRKLWLQLWPLHTADISGKFVGPCPHLLISMFLQLGRGTAAAMCCDPAATLLVLEQELS